MKRATRPLSVDSGVQTPPAGTGSHAPQILTLRDFPDTHTARVLSPNGRYHWGAQNRAKGHVRGLVSVALLWANLTPARPPVSIVYRWIVPDRRKRDLDNHGTGVIKVVQDHLVTKGVLPAGDHSDVLTSRVEIVYEKGRRALVIEIREANRD